MRRDDERGGEAYLLQIEVEGLEPGHGGDELPLVALDALDGDDAVGDAGGVLLLRLLGLGSLLLRVLGGALLRLDGQRGRGRL